MYTAEDLFSLARYRIETHWGDPETKKPPISFDLNKEVATFVTLNLDGKLRGCIGSLTATRPLWLDVQENAYSAAFNDFRFSPLSKEEYENIHVEISVLSEVTRVEFDSVDTLRAKIRPGIDGIVYRHMGRRATFLPQVWEQIPDFDTFFSRLSQKAGLGPDPELIYATVERYQVDKYSE